MERYRLIQTLANFQIIGNFRTICGPNLNLQLNHIHYAGWDGRMIYMVEFKDV